MTNNAVKMTMMRIIYSFFKSFIMIFVNIYLWQTGKSIQAVALFNFFNYLAAAGGFHLGNITALRSGRLNYMLSSASFIALFTTTLYLGDNAWQYAILLGLLGGMGDGFFFFNLNFFQASELDKDEMDRFMAWLGAVTKATAVVAPLLSGLLMQWLGFRAMVVCLLGLLVLQLFLSLTVPSGTVKTLPQFNIKAMLTRSSLRNTLLTHTVRAPYNEFTILTNSVFLFIFAQNESFTGILNSIFSVSSIVMFWAYRRLQKKYTRQTLMLYGAVVHTAAILFLFQPSLFSFVLYSLCATIGGAFFGQPLTGVQIHAAKAHADTEAEMLGYLQSRVVLLTLGRCLFFGAVYLWYDGFSTGFYSTLLIINLFIPLLSYAMIRREI